MQKKQMEQFTHRKLSWWWTTKVWTKTQQGGGGRLFKAKVRLWFERFPDLAKCACSCVCDLEVITQWGEKCMSNRAMVTVYAGFGSSAEACVTKRHQVWHEADRQAYGAILTQSGNNHKLGIAGWQQCVGWWEQCASMCSWLRLCLSEMKKDTIFEFELWSLKMPVEFRLYYWYT